MMVCSAEARKAESSRHQAAHASVASKCAAVNEDGGAPAGHATLSLGGVLTVVEVELHKTELLRADLHLQVARGG